MSSKIQFEIIEGPGQGEIREYNKNFINIGSLATDDLVFDSSTGVLPNHASVRLEDNKVIFINNCFSTIYINGSIISQKELEHNDEIKFGYIGPKLRFISSDISDKEKRGSESLHISQDKGSSEEMEMVSSPAPKMEESIVEAPCVTDTPVDMVDTIEPENIDKTNIAEATIYPPLDPPSFCDEELTTSFDMPDPVDFEDQETKTYFTSFENGFESFDKQIITDDSDFNDSFYTYKETHSAYQKTVSNSDSVTNEEVNYTIESKSSDRPEDSTINVDYKKTREVDKEKEIIEEYTFNIDADVNITQEEDNKNAKEPDKNYSKHIKESFKDIKTEIKPETASETNKAYNKTIKRPVAPGRLNTFVYIYEFVFQDFLAKIVNAIDDFFVYQPPEHKKLKLEIEKTIDEHKKKKQKQEFFFSYKRKQDFMKEHHTFYVNSTIATLAINALFGVFPCIGQFLGLAVPVIVSTMTVKAFNQKYKQMEKREAHTIILCSSIIITFNFLMFLYHLFLNYGSPYRVLLVFLTGFFMLIQLVITNYFVFKDARYFEEKEFIK